MSIFASGCSHAICAKPPSGCRKSFCMSTMINAERSISASFAAISNLYLPVMVPRHVRSAFVVRLTERQNGAGDFAGFHCAERFVDVRKAAPTGDHRVEIEPALSEKIKVERDVIAEAVRTHARGLHLAFRADCHPRKLNHRVWRQHADNGCRAADREALDRLAYEPRIADRLKGVIDAGAAGQRTDRLDRVVVTAVDKMCG